MISTYRPRDLKVYKLHTWKPDLEIRKLSSWKSEDLGVVETGGGKMSTEDVETLEVPLVRT